MTLNAHTYRLTEAEATYKFEPCQGYPSGYPGGVIASGPTCVQITVKTPAMEWATRLGFWWTALSHFGGPLPSAGLS